MPCHVMPCYTHTQVYKELQQDVITVRAVDMSFVCHASHAHDCNSTRESHLNTA